MSADNFIGVYEDNGEWVVCHGFMSPLCDSDDPEFAHHYPDGYRGTERSRHPSRDTALVAAHDAAARETVLEYGVIELSPVAPRADASESSDKWGRTAVKAAAPVDTTKRGS